MLWGIVVVAIVRLLDGQSEAEARERIERAVKHIVDEWIKTNR